VGEALLTRRILAPAALLLLAGAGSAQTPPAEPVAPAPLVTAIEIRSETDIGDRLAELQGMLSLAPGEPFTAEATARTLRNIQASGIASQVEIYDRPDETETGVLVMVVLRPVVRVSAVRLEGELGVREREARRELPQKEAEPLNEERVVQGVFSLQDFYRDRGYLHAMVHVDVTTNDRTQRSIVTYRIQSGPRSRVEDVQFRGAIDPFQKAELISHLNLKPGAAYARRTARDDAERLQTWLIQQGYRTARVDAPVEEIEAQKNAVVLTYPVQVGPVVTLQVIGAEEKQLKKRDLLPFLGNQGFDDALVLQAKERLTDDYQRQGYYKVKIDFDPPKTADGILKLVLRIVPGPQYTLRDVTFTGNNSFDSNRLAPLMTTSSRSLLNLGSGRLVDSQLKADLENVRSFYALQGYSQATVGPPEIKEEGADLHLTIPIKEGGRQQLVNLKFAGVESIDLNALRKKLPLKEGGPFHPFLLDQTLELVRQAYRDKGYADAQVSAKTEWDAGQSLADVTIEAFEGEQMVLDRVIVRGNQHTDSDVIRRTLGVKPGQPISETRRLEIERDLYRLGIFSSVSVELTRTGLSSSGQDLIVKVEEGLPRRVSYSLGLEYVSANQNPWQPQGGFSFIHNNVGGKAYSLRTDLRVSQLDQDVRVLLDQPTIGRLALPLAYSIFFFNETKDHWNVVRWGGRLEAARKFGDRRMSLAWDYRFVHTTIDPGFGLTDVDREDRPYQISSFYGSLLLDHRNDPVLATRGWSSLVQLQYAVPLLAATGDFFKIFFQQTQYINLGRPGVVAMSLRGGGIEPFRHLNTDDPEVPPGLLNRDVFIDERFFAGGPTTQRAYGRDDLGVRGETLFPKPTDPTLFAPVGGNGLLLLNLEYRFPVAGPVEGVVFYDAGNVWADWRSITLGGTKGGAGIGVRYLSPIGPFRLDVGWKLDPERRDPRHVISLSFGNPF
jgi:outer membrane protein insertion porin family